METSMWRSPELWKINSRCDSHSASAQVTQISYLDTMQTRLSRSSSSPKSNKPRHHFQIALSPLLTKYSCFDTTPDEDAFFWCAMLPPRFVTKKDDENGHDPCLIPELSLQPPRRISGTRVSGDPDLLKRPSDGTRGQVVDIWVIGRRGWVAEDEYFAVDVSQMSYLW